MDKSDKQKLAHDSLLKEILNIDEIAEKHSDIIIGISGILIGILATQSPSPEEALMISVFGILLSIEWILKLIRHRLIFRTSYDKLVNLQKDIGIDALRPLPKPHRMLFSFDGFTILIWLGIAFLLFWVWALVYYENAF
jgi:uncharacterized membrane protein HdeD (DUF308 family)